MLHRRGWGFGPARGRKARTERGCASPIRVALCVVLFAVPVAGVGATVVGTAANAVTSGNADGVLSSPRVATVPGAPTVGHVSPEDAFVFLPFAAPGDDGGSAIETYTATCVSSDGGATSSASDTESPMVVSGLTNGHTYTCTVTATNAVGVGPPSGPTDVFVPAGLPGFPTVGVVTLTGRVASVPFTPPAPSGGVPILSYTAYCVLSNGTGRLTGSSAASPVMVTLGLGKTYVCAVAARNLAGEGALSFESNAVSVPDLPTVPVAVQAMSRPTAIEVGALAVSFTQPNSNGGSSITGYAARCSSSNGGVTITTSGPVSPLTVTGLTTGKTYTCAVLARNVVGGGPFSAASAAVIVGSPAPPTAVRALPGAASTTTGLLTLTFTPGLNNGAAVTSDTATCTSTNGGVTRSVSSATSALTVTGLTTAKAYTCRVQARNARGLGSSSAASVAVIVGSPIPPALVTAVKVASGRFKVTFTPGASNGAAVTSYTATCASTNGGVMRSASSTASPVTVVGLTPGKTYICAVKATNGRGTGVSSSASPAVAA